jgi:hypothetical protein
VRCERDIKVEVKVEVENKKNRRISKSPLGDSGVVLLPSWKVASRNPAEALGYK